MFQFSWLILATGTGARNVRDDPARPLPIVAGRELDGNHVHNCGNILLHVTNFGLIGSTPTLNQRYSNAPSAQWPKGRPTDYLWAAGLWIGAIKDGDPRVTSCDGVEIEFQPGLSELDRIYETREQAPGGARLPSPNADDDHDGSLDEDWLDGRDNDGDGFVDEDFAAVSNQMFFCEYGDDAPSIRHVNPDHVPLEVSVRQSSMCWDSPLTDDFIAFDFEIVNRGVYPLSQVYLGFWADCDIGPRDGVRTAEDDYAGFWEGTELITAGLATKPVKVSMGYMWDDDGDRSQSEGYIGLMFLGAQDPSSNATSARIALKNFRYFTGSAAFDEGGDPTNDAERYAVLDGLAPKSLPPPNATTGLRMLAPAKRKGDYRMVVSAGPFESVAPEDTLGFQAALVIGRGFAGLVDNAVQAQLTYDGVYADCDQDPETGIEGRETPLCGPEITGLQRFDECDSLCSLEPEAPHCSADVPADGCIYVNADCVVEKATGVITGVNGQECLVHWLADGLAPPPPHMRLVVREGQVDVLWDNTSETTPDLRLNTVDFESYRVWRADDWNRPWGTTTTTGPGSDLWKLLGEYDLPGNLIGSDVGLDAIRYRPGVGDHAIEFYRAWALEHPFQPAPRLPEMTDAQIDTAKAMGRGMRYYRFTDPPFMSERIVSGPCTPQQRCPTIESGDRSLSARCNRSGFCQATTPPPHSGAHYFYSITATDHRLQLDASGNYGLAGAGLGGDPSSNFIYVSPPTDAIPVDAPADQVASEIYVVPNPATAKSMSDWKLQPNNEDPTGIKIEFHHLPRARGTVTIFTLAGDLVQTLPFDARNGNGTLPWNLVSRNGQDVTSGVYLYIVEADAPFERFLSKFVVIR